MFKESYEREDIARSLSREEGQNNNGGTEIDTDTIKETNIHTQEAKKEQRASIRKTWWAWGGSGGPWSNLDEHAHLSRMKIVP